MTMTDERRTEERLRYHWPIWFAENVHEELWQGQMTDLSSQAAAFTCHADQRCPYPGQYITARFSVPQYGHDGAFEMLDFVRSGHVGRVDEVNSVLRRVALHFAEPLPLRPGEQAAAETEEEALEPLMV
jgi:hypothetical protein